MPSTRRTVSVCAQSGCPTLTANTRCDQHATDSGYNHTHRNLRAQWARRMRQGELVACSRCGHPIHPLEPWHLDHTDDRTAYHGPAHAHCNSAAHAQP